MEINVHCCYKWIVCSDGVIIVSMPVGGKPDTRPEIEGFTTHSVTAESVFAAFTMRLGCRIQ
jgi:hypothetical protein